MTQEARATNSESDFAYLRRELARRTVSPFKQVPFLIFLFLAILGFGAWGIWIECYRLASGATREWSGILTALITFFSALVASGAMQLVYEGFDRSDKVFGAVFAAIAVILLGLAIWLLSTSISMPIPVLVLSIICSMVAVWVWVVASCDDPLFKARPRPDAAIGGDVEAAVNGSVSGIIS